MTVYGCTKRQMRKRRELYGLEPEEYNAMFAAQNGLCAICKTKPIAGVDHDHETGKARGLLCVLGNFGLGQFKDNPALMRAAAVYIEEHEEASFVPVAAVRCMSEILFEARYGKQEQ